MVDCDRIKYCDVQSLDFDKFEAPAVSVSQFSM
jgi:hypothetical protein